MKNFLFLALLPTLCLASIVDESIYTLKDAYAFNVAKPRYGINPARGTAWVEVYYEYHWGDEYADVFVKRKEIPGLFYSSDEKAILFQNGDEVIVCAENIKKKFLFLKWNEMQQNSRCHFEINHYIKKGVAPKELKAWENESDYTSQETDLTNYRFVID